MVSYRGASLGNPDNLRQTSAALYRVGNTIGHQADVFDGLAGEVTARAGDNSISTGLKTILSETADLLRNAHGQVDEGGTIIGALASALSATDGDGRQYEWALCALPSAEEGGLSQAQAELRYHQLTREAHGARRRAASELGASVERTRRTRKHHPTLLRRFFRSLGGGVVDFGKGFFVNGLGGVVGGAADIVTGKVNPLDIVRAVADDPAGFAKGTLDAVIDRETWNENKVRWAGGIGFNVLATLATAGAGAAAKGTTVSGKIGRAADDLGDVSKAARAADEGAAALGGLRRISNVVGLDIAKNGYHANLGSLAKRVIPVRGGGDLRLTAEQVRGLEHLRPDRVNHALFGETIQRGGHLNGPGSFQDMLNPRYTPFPSGWDGRKAIDAAYRVLRDPKSSWHLQDHGTHRIDGLVDGHPIRVVVDLRDDPRVVTIHPLK